MIGTDSTIPKGGSTIDTTFLCKMCIIVLLGLNLTEAQIGSLLI